MESSLFPHTLQNPRLCTFSPHCSLTLHIFSICVHAQSSLFPHTLQNQPLCAHAVLTVPSHSTESASVCRFSPQCSLTLYRIILCVHDQYSVSSHTLQNQPLSARSVLTVTSHSTELASVCTCSPHCSLTLYSISLRAQRFIVPSHSTESTFVCTFSPHCSLKPNRISPEGTISPVTSLYRISLCVHAQYSVFPHTL